MSNRVNARLRRDRRDSKPRPAVRPATSIGQPERLESRACPAVFVLEPIVNRIVEGEAAEFRIRLAAPASVPLSVEVATVSGTARIGTDFAHATQRILFAPGQTVKTFQIQSLVEPTPVTEGREAFDVVVRPLGTASPAALRSTVTIDDLIPRAISAQNQSIVEGQAGTSQMTFTVSLSTSATQQVSVRYATRDGSATVAGNDYVATSGTLTFGLGETTKTFSVTVNGDTVLERDEAFFVDLSGASRGFTVISPNLSGTIRNDETDLPGFQISVNYLTPVQPAWRQAVSRAVAKWQSIIVGDVPGVVHQGRFIDDFEIAVSFQSLAPDRLGFARYLEQRPGVGGLPFRGEMVMNTVYANLPGLYDTVVHELAHALGFSPELWTQRGLLGGTAADPRFLGPNALREFNRAFASTATGVPLFERGTPGDGSYGAHWRNSVMGTEIMVSELDPRGTNVPVSRITVGHFADIGYSVNYAAADGYSPPSARGFTETQPQQRAISPAWAALNRPLRQTVLRPEGSIALQMPSQRPVTASAFASFTRPPRPTSGN